MADLASDNIYMNGGNSIADALNKQDQKIKVGGASTSIAMRLKKNRDALLAGNDLNSNNDANSNSNKKQNINGSDEKLYSANPFKGLSGSNNVNNGNIVGSNTNYG